jgi:hypothetical protein
MSELRMHRLTIAFLGLTLLSSFGRRVALAADGSPDPETQILSGSVTDEKNNPIPGAACTLTGPALPQQGRPVTTDEKGTFQFTGLVPGTYQLTCAAVGYEPVMQGGLEVTEAAAPSLQMVLPAEVVIRQRVEVTGKATQVTAETTAPPAELTSQQLRVLPLAEQRFKAALPLVPGVVRTPDGRISIKGAIETQGTLLIDSAETVDPVTGSFSIEVPIDAVESLEVYKSAYQAQYGRFSGGLTVVQSKAPAGKWHFELNDFLPSLRIRSGQIVGIEDDSPRLYLTGPLWKDKLTFSESLMYEFSRQPVRGLAWPNNETKKEGLQSFTNFYYVLSPQHLLSANVKVFPERRQFADINSLIPQPASADYGQRGYSLGGTDRYMFTSGGVLTTLAQFTQFDSYAHGQGPQDMLVTPNGWGGNFFNKWTRFSAQQEVLQSYSFPHYEWHGQHDIKVGWNVNHRAYSGISQSRPVQVLRADGSLAEQIDFTGAGELNANDTEFAGFYQDHWAFNDMLAVDYGLRLSGQTLGESSAVSPRVGLVFSPASNGRTVLRTGAGVFYDRLPLLAGDFTNNLTRSVTFFDPQGLPLGPSIAYTPAYVKFEENGQQVVPTRHELDSTPYNFTWSVELDQEIRPSVIARVSYLSSRTYNQFTLDPQNLGGGQGVLLLSNRGGSRYHEFETTLRLRPSDKVDINISYVKSLDRGDLNTLSSVFVPFEQPVIRPNFFATLPVNVPNRVITWSRFSLPWKVTVSPIFDVHEGFPYSVIDTLQNYVGNPNSQRLPTFASLDMQFTKDFRLKFIPFLGKHTLRGSMRIYNVTNHGNYRDVYNNLDSPFFQHFVGIQHRFFDFSFDIVY